MEPLESYLWRASRVGARGGAAAANPRRTAAQSALRQLHCARSWRGVGTACGMEPGGAELCLVRCKSVGPAFGRADDTPCAAAHVVGVVGAATLRGEQGLLLSEIASTSVREKVSGGLREPRVESRSSRRAVACGVCVFERFSVCGRVRWLRCV